MAETKKDALVAFDAFVDEASAAASVIEMYRRAIETTEIEQRLRAVEEAQQGNDRTHREPP
jgi:hypothetical protein